VVDLQVGQSVMGSFDGTLSSDGRTARLELGSAMSAGEISGAYTLVLADPYNIEGKVTVRNMALDALILARCTCKHSVGTASGWRNRLEWFAEATGEHFVGRKILATDIQLRERATGECGPGTLRSSRDNLQIEPAEFRGTDTDLVLAEISVSRSVRR